MRLLHAALLILPLVLSPARAQGPSAPPAAQVGVDEKLGAGVPKDLTFKDEEGKDVKLGSLLGKPTVLTLNYYRCAGICTPQLNGFVDVLQKVKPLPGQDFQVITVSFDPRDTPDIAVTKRANYLKQVGRPIEPHGWRFLTGPGETSRALADAVGFKYKQEGGEFIHAAALMILSPDGKVTRYMYGVDFLPADLEMALQEAARGEARPTISKWLSICFTTDPEGRRTVFSFTRTAAVVLILGAIVFGIIAARRGRRKAS